MSDIFRAHSRCFASFLLLLFAVQWSALITDDLESSLVVTVSDEHHVSDASGEHSVGCDTDTECDHCCQCHGFMASADCAPARLPAPPARVLALRPPLPDAPADNPFRPPIA